MKNLNVSSEYGNEGKNKTNTQKTIIVQKFKNKDNNSNNYLDININKNIKPVNIDINIEIDNIHSNNIKKISQNNIIDNDSKSINKENKNIFNLINQNRNVNSEQKIIIQKISNKVCKIQEKRSFKKEEVPKITKLSKNKNISFIHNLSDNDITTSESLQPKYNQSLDENSNLLNNNINEETESNNNISEEFKNPKNEAFNRIKENNQYILRNNNNNINNENNNGNNNESIKINDIREELRLIHDNRKYNYDRKIQKNSHNKNQVPQSKKIVEKILGLNEKQIENKIPDKTNISIYDIKSHDTPRINILYNINNNSNKNLLDIERKNISQKKNLDTGLNNNNTNYNNNINNNIKVDPKIINLNRNLYSNQSGMILPPPNLKENHLNDTNNNPELITNNLNQNNNNQQKLNMVLPNVNIIYQQNQLQNINIIKKKTIIYLNNF